MAKKTGFVVRLRFSQAFPNQPEFGWLKPHENDPGHTICKNRDDAHVYDSRVSAEDALAHYRNSDESDTGECVEEIV